MSFAEVEFFLGDALDMNVCDWSDATVVFANSTCFDDALMRRLASAATALKKGTIFITLTKRLPVGGDSKEKPTQCIPRVCEVLIMCVVCRDLSDDVFVASAATNGPTPHPTGRTRSFRAVGCDGSR